MIKANNVVKSFSGETILKGVSANFERGKTNLIIGESGSGKTVFLKSLIGIHDIDSGSIYYDDIHFSTLGINEKKKVRKDIGMLFQGSALFDSMTVEENVAFPLTMFSEMSKSEIADRVNFCLNRVNIHGRNKLLPSEISGGMQKRVAIARAISTSPKYLFCDEPNSGLDPKTGIVIDNLIKEITEEFNMVTIINTHDMNSVIEIGQNIYFIHQGNIWWNGDNHEILHSDNQELNDFVFATELVRRIKQ